MSDARASRVGPPPRGKARVHTRTVRLLRFLLPLTMIAVAGLLAGLVVAHAIRRQAAARAEVASPIRMVNPHFYGRDNSGRPYTLAAHEAARDEHWSQRVLLVGPTLVLDTGAAHPSTLSADHGVYQEDSRVLSLSGHVRAVDAKGARFASEAAVVNTRTGQVTGPKPLVGASSTGAVQAQSFQAYDKGDRVVFKGGVHARLTTH
ncbi:MAG TPA: LPS export ABC transporter periplasmic protein LptC [Caulobacteraceae bacterium]|jgi:lipopolysaccharide export system protein LptC|nr:LPS export ABC transporter periplasmic protein LptC [Caulobacteraceae bacterium]